MNIGIFVDAYPPYINGVATSSYNLAKVLKEHGHTVLVVTPRFTDGKLELIDDVCYVPGIQDKALYGYRFTSPFPRKAYKIVKKYKLDVIHNQTDSTIGIFARLAAKRLKLPLVYTYHTAFEEYSYYASKGYLDRIAKAILRKYARIIAKNATEFITPSYKTKEYMRSIGSDRYIEIVPTGIDFSSFSKPQDVEKEKEFKLKHNIGESTKVVLMLGRIAKEKSMDYSLKCFAKYLQVHPDMDIKMIVVGDGPQKGEYELLSHELKISHKVEFIGSVDASEVGFYYKLADVYTSASLSETQGLTFMEAMACRTVVLARFDNNLADTIIDNNTGFFFNNEDNFVEKLDRIFALSNDELEEVKNNATKLLEYYSFDNFYNNIMGVYNRAIKKYW